ncbi:hypothetical protein QR680_002786 [Steinernema hermaphroditum]|uniref:Uncharacterized protein n=1 Tax=Steinernema hermaphroditum TaxID=289476 RepID=A0AA39H454_9BILA|nr:hypothetical protein QR680_002786 [Steinernema hermaphroditum]
MSEDFSRQIIRLHYPGLLTTLCVTVDSVIAKHLHKFNRPLVLICHGIDPSMKMSIIAFNFFQMNVHTALNLHNMLVYLSCGQIEGKTFVFHNVTIERNPPICSSQDGVDRNMVRAIFEPHSSLALAVPNSPMSNLVYWKSSTILNINRAFVIRVYYRIEDPNRCRVVLLIHIEHKKFEVITHLWTTNYARNVRQDLDFLRKRQIRISNAAFLNHHLYNPQKVTIQLRRKSRIGLYKRCSDEHTSETVMMSDFEGPHHPDAL